MVSSTSDNALPEVASSPDHQMAAVSTADSVVAIREMLSELSKVLDRWYSEEQRDHDERQGGGSGRRL
ncbi:hypothetical protein ACFQ2B_38670 [Streptomyces stramineus]|uniref:Uncharacterized protein n=1 Tax=Streptomyces stramineus TaxID=173861 RepID=A0ABN1A4Q1_9ACTN